MLSLITLSLWEVPTAADTAKFTDIKKGEAPVPRGFALDNGGLRAWLVGLSTCCLIMRQGYR